MLGLVAAGILAPNVGTSRPVTRDAGVGPISPSFTTLLDAGMPVGTRMGTCAHALSYVVVTLARMPPRTRLARYAVVGTSALRSIVDALGMGTRTVAADGRLARACRVAS